MSQVARGDVVIRGVGGQVVRVDPAMIDQERPKTLWSVTLLHRVAAMALANNAVLVAGSVSADESDNIVMALDINDGHVLWKHPLPSPPASWAMALDGAGRISIALRDGRVLCLAAAKK